MGFERTHTLFNATPKRNAATPKGIKKYLTFRCTFLMPSITNHKVNNSCHTPPKYNHNGLIGTPTRPFATLSGTNTERMARLRVAMRKL